MFATVLDRLDVKAEKHAGVVFRVVLAVLALAIGSRSLHVTDVPGRSPDERVYTHFAQRIADEGSGNMHPTRTNGSTHRRPAWCTWCCSSYCLLATLGARFVLLQSEGWWRGKAYPLVLALTPVAIAVVSLRDHSLYADVVIRSGMQDLAARWISMASRGARSKRSTRLEHRSSLRQP